MSKTTVLIIGLDPALIDFTNPPYNTTAGMTGQKLHALLDADDKSLQALGFEITQCLVDFGMTAETVVREQLRSRRFEVVVIGAGIRLHAENTPLFEALVNAVHECAPQAKLYFNTRPNTTAEAVQRWSPAA